MDMDEQELPNQEAPMQQDPDEDAITRRAAAPEDDETERNERYAG